MQDIIRPFLARAIYVALIIFGSNLLGEPIPVTSKQNGLFASLTVGIPVFFLAGWVRPGETPRRLIPSSGHFVLSAAITIVVDPTIYQYFMTMTHDLELARTALTITSLLRGLTLIPFLEPSTESWAGGDEISGDWRQNVIVRTSDWPIARWHRPRARCRTAPAGTPVADAISSSQPEHH